MSGFIEGEARTQATLFPERLDDYIAEDNPVRVIDVFIDGLNLAVWGLKRCLKSQDAPHTIPPPCSSSTSMVILIGCCQHAV